LEPVGLGINVLVVVLNERGAFGLSCSLTWSGLWGGTCILYSLVKMCLKPHVLVAAQLLGVKKKSFPSSVLELEQEADILGQSFEHLVGEALVKGG
jgi:hypothetical protein